MYFFLRCIFNTLIKCVIFLLLETQDNKLDGDMQGLSTKFLAYLEASSTKLLELT